MEKIKKNKKKIIIGIIIIIVAIILIVSGIIMIKVLQQTKEQKENEFVDVEELPELSNPSLSTERTYKEIVFSGFAIKKDGDKYIIYIYTTNSSEMDFPEEQASLVLLTEEQNSTIIDFTIPALKAKESKTIKIETTESVFETERYSVVAKTN